MILGLHHPAISTANLERLVDFYTSLLRFDEVYRAGWPVGAEVQNRLLGAEGSGARLVMLRQANAYLEIFQFDSPPTETRDRQQRLFGQGLTHLCLAVRDIEAEYRRLCDAGMEFNTSPLHRGPFSVVYGRDPDGNAVELLEHHDATQAFAPHWRRPDRAFVN